MGFSCGIIGLPNVGKSTLFNALTSSSLAQTANYPFCTIEPNVGRVAVPDETLEHLAGVAKSEKVVPTYLDFVDIAGLVKGANEGEGLRDAWEKAFETDKQAPFGGVIVCNRPLNEGLARVIAEIFTDIIIAPDFDSDARAILQKKKSLRLIKVADEFFKNAINAPVVRSAPGGLLVMDSDPKVLGLDEIEKKVKTKRPPSADEIEAMKFTWRICKHVKSNAIVFGSKDRTLGIGAGQMSRVDSCRIAIWKASEAGLSLSGSSVASDAMFPFADGLISAVEAGATSCIQPGGSIRDEEVVMAADERDVAMVFTGHRHFLH